MKRKGRSGSTSIATYSLTRMAPMLRVQWAEEEVAEEVAEEVTRCLEERTEEKPRKVASLRTEEVPEDVC